MNILLYGFVMQTFDDKHLNTITPSAIQNTQCQYQYDLCTILSNH